MPNWTGKTILVVDEDPIFLSVMTEVFLETSAKVVTCDSFDEAKEYANRKTIDVIFLDLDSAPPRIVEKFMVSFPTAKVIVTSARADSETLAAALRAGAQTYLPKPIDAATVLQTLAPSLNPMVNPSLQASRPLIGESAAMSRVRRQIDKMKNVDTTVLISGESGSGKEVVARSLHFESDRAKAPFRAINCAALPGQLVESELFGARKGSFTDAKVDKKGLFEVCDKGTLFLDEIGELPLETQSKLLRVLQEKEFFPVGSTDPVKSNVKVVVATNKKLKSEVQKGDFREDLYYRISVLEIYIPPLRERLEDLMSLARYFLDFFQQKHNHRVKCPSDKMLENKLLSYNWPGNVRELQNVIERSVVMSDSVLELDIPVTDVSPMSEIREEVDLRPIQVAKDDFEKTYLLKLLKFTGGDISQLAAIAKRHRTDVYRLLHKYDIKV